MIKLFVISDVHGHYSLMIKALIEAGFEENNPHHLLVCLGDYFDRGTENKQVMQYFERLPHKVLLKGNHDDYLEEILTTNKLTAHGRINGVISTLTEFFGKENIDGENLLLERHSNVVKRLFAFMDTLKDYYETKNYVFVHGWINEENDWKKARKTPWTNKYYGIRPLEHKTLVVGHVPTYLKTNKPDIFYGEGLIAIDAGTYDTHTVNVLVLEEEIN